MRVLFLHLSRNSSYEYKVHRLLAQHADPKALDCYFVCQNSVRDHSADDMRMTDSQHVLLWDFGRDMEIVPKPSRLYRAIMMATRLPGSLIFLVRHIHALKPDVIYTSQQQVEVQLAAVMHRMFRVPHLIHLHYNVGPWLGRICLYIIQRTPCLVACSGFVRQGAVAMGVPESSIDVIHNAIDVQRFDVAGDRDRTRAAFQLPKETPLVVAAGRLDPSKGYMTLLNAFASVRRQIPEAHLLICGETTRRDGVDLLLKHRAAEQDLANSVTFAGRRSDLPEIFAAADLFCLPSEEEPFGLVFAEAMIARLAVVACRSGGVPEIVADGVSGLLSAVGDSSMLATNIATLLRDRARARAMGEAGRARALALFSPQIVAAQWVRLLQRRIVTTGASSP